MFSLVNYRKAIKLRRKSLQRKNFLGKKNYTGKLADLTIFCTFSIGNLPSPTIVDRGQSLECVSLFVSNSNKVWWIDQPQLIKGKDYTVELVENKTHSLDLDGYQRLKLIFLNERKEIFKNFQQNIDDTQKNTLCYYLTFACGAQFDKVILIQKINITVGFEGKYYTPLEFFPYIIISIFESECWHHTILQ